MVHILDRVKTITPIELDGKDKIHKWKYAGVRIKQKTYKTRESQNHSQRR